MLAATLAGAVMVALIRPPADAVRRAQVASAGSPTGGATPLPSSMLTAAPASALAVSVVDVDADLGRLRQIALDTGGSRLQWPQQPMIADAACADASGRAGTARTLTGRFTTRDPATATDNNDFLSITQANEKVARQIVDAWATGGIVAAPWPLHGEWEAGDGGHRTLDRAHIGFVDGVGDIRVTGACVTAG